MKPTAPLLLLLGFMGCSAAGRSYDLNASSATPAVGARVSSDRNSSPEGGWTSVDDSPEEEAKPWRLADALGTPEWLTLRGQQRTRYETVDGQFRAGRTGEDHIFAFRTRIEAIARRGDWELGGEIMDSRQSSADMGTPLSTGIVNAVEVLQAWVGWNVEDLFGTGDQGKLIFGRHTMDIGSRRLVARNRYRNTINNFTGLNGTLKTADGVDNRAFFVLPVRRRPTDFDGLRDNHIQLDEETEHVRFFGVHSKNPNLIAGASTEFYAFGLHEDDGGGFATRDRSLTTAGARVEKKRSPGALDYEFELVYQFGDSRASRSGSDTTDLDHKAFFHHSEVGYSLEGSWKPRIALELDVASGDDDPTDGENNRFDTLYGARRGEFGPTSIYGPFARSNLFTPGLRLDLAPRDDVGLMFSYRLHSLESDRDAWTAAGVVDPTGNSGDDLGQFAEVRVRWKAVPDSVHFEGGVGRHFTGSFVDNAPNSNGEGDTTYAYLEVTFSF